MCHIRLFLLVSMPSASEVHDALKADPKFIEPCVKNDSEASQVFMFSGYPA